MATDIPTGLTEPVVNGVHNPNTNGAALPADTTSTTAPGLSADEIAQYDRQLRLWGVEAQNRIRSANILLISLRALGTEIAKNLTLAGISSLTIIDNEPVTEEDLGAGYFLREDDIGRPRAEAAIPRIQQLNPRVNIMSGGSLPDLLQRNQTFYTPFSCVIACDHDFLTLSTINTTARFASVPFYAAGIHGFYGFIFADLVAHDFVVERERSNIPTSLGLESGSGTRSVLSVTAKRGEGGANGGKAMEIVAKRELYCPLLLANSSPLPRDVLGSKRKLKSVPSLLPCLRALFDFQRTFARLPDPTSPPDLAAFTTSATAKTSELQLPADTLKAEFLRSFVQYLGAEIVPTAAFVGGRLAEDVINVLGKREQPIQNFAFFDGESFEGRIYSLYSPPPELTMMVAGAGVDLDLGGAMPVLGVNGNNGANGAVGANGVGMGATTTTAGMGNGGASGSEAIVLD